MLYNVPIESLDARYSTQWNELFPKVFKDAGIDFVTVTGSATSGKIRHGQFLDVVETNRWKSEQLTVLLRAITNGALDDGDTIFFHDLWFPGIESLFYVRDALNLKFQVTGILHAGTYDPHDYLTKRGMTRWAKRMEQAWFNEVDLIFLATYFHRDLLVAARMDNLDSTRRLKVTGLPLYHPYLQEQAFHIGRWDSPRKRQIVFPHRITDEKQPHLFEALRVLVQAEYPNWEFVRSQDVPRTKQEYFDLLLDSTIAVSFNLQETWGIAMQEALDAGCLCFVPERLSYPEMFSEVFRYSNAADLGDRVLQIIAALERHAEALDLGGVPSIHDVQQLKEFADKMAFDQNRLAGNRERAIPNMLAAMRASGWLL